MQTPTPIVSAYQLKQMKVMQFVLSAGPSILFVTAIVLYVIGYGVGNMTENKSALLIMLTATHFATLGLLFPVSIVLPVRFLSRFKKVRGSEASGKIVVAAHTLRNLLMMIPTLFGLSVILLAIHKGILFEEPLYWVNAASFLILVAQSLLQGPTEKRVEYWYGSTFESV